MLITTVVTDDGVPALSATNSFEVIVDEVNSAPAFDTTPSDVTIDELTLLSVTNAATDGDSPANALSYQLLGAPAGATIDAAGQITWTPTEGQGPSTNVIVTVVTDDGIPALSATNSFEVIVDEVNSAPAFDATPADVTLDELTPLSVANAASDGDSPANGLSYQLLSAPAGAAIDAAGQITWTPSEGQGPSTNVITTVVTDDGTPALSVTNSFEVIVDEVNSAPAFDATPSDVTIDELTPLSVANAASDGDSPANALSYQLLGAPAGAAIDAAGQITWIPTESQGPSSNVITTVVTDDGTPALSATNSFEVIVDEVNTAPAFDATPADVTLDELTLLSVANAASDGDSPANGLSYQLLGAPAGAAIDAAGQITWTPIEGQGPSTNLITTIVTDDGSPSLSATNSFEVIVDEVNSAPAFDATPSDVTINELTLLSVANAASDGDSPANGLSYQLLGAPAGAAIDAAGQITWIPTESQGPSTNLITTVVTDDGIPALSATNSFEVIVDEVNSAPAFDATPADVTLDELTLLGVSNGASDGDSPANGLSYQLLGAPAGAAIDAAGQITWTPTEGQGPSTNVIVTVVTDDGTPALSATNSFEVIVDEVNSAPAFDATPSDVTIDELTLFSVANAASDGDSPANGLSYRLLGAPAGASIDAAGQITWTPNEAQGPSTNLIVTVVTDDGSPALSATNNFEVIVDEVNSAPAFDATPSDVTIDELTPLSVANAASDGDSPANGLSYQLLGAPAGAAIDAAGQITWTPTEGQGPSTNLIVTVVTDDGVPALSATNSFVIFVNESIPAPIILSVEFVDGTMPLTWTSTAGESYMLETVIVATDTNWIAMPPSIPATGPTATATNTLDGAIHRLFRIRRVVD